MIDPRRTATEWGIVKIFRPVGCIRKMLSLNAIDEHSRQLAQETYVEFNGQLISCQSIKVEIDDTLVLRIPRRSYEFVDADREVADAKS